MVVQEKADYKVLTGDKKKAEMMRGNKSKNISEMPVWLQKAVNSGAEDRVAKLEEKKDQRKLLKMEEVMEIGSEIGMGMEIGMEMEMEMVMEMDMDMLVASE